MLLDGTFQSLLLLLQHEMLDGLSRLQLHSHSVLEMVLRMYMYMLKMQHEMFNQLDEQDLSLLILWYQVELHHLSELRQTLNLQHILD